MKIRIKTLFLVLALIAGIHQAAAQGTQFFRISGPAASGITAFRADGTLVWTNAQAGTNYTIQTVAALPGGTNWVDYVQLPVTQSVNTNQIVSFNPPAGMTFIPAGSFTMGNFISSWDGDVNTNDPDITDAHPTNVYVANFYMDANLVSYSQWQTVYTYASSHGFGFDHAGSAQTVNQLAQPVQTVNWYDVVKWCNARSQQAGLTPVYCTDVALTQVYTNGDVDLTVSNVNWSANGYRLPTEAEWEKAARGGFTGQRFPWGNTISESQANYRASPGTISYDLGPYSGSGYNTNFDTGGSPYTSPVGYFAPNGYSLFDMTGNVWEWCWDWYGTPYGEPTTDNPTGPASGTFRVVRGGGWNGGATYDRCAGRTVESTTAAASTVGFRCVRRQ